jgi:hypothetical protein
MEKIYYKLFWIITIFVSVIQMNLKAHDNNIDYSCKAFYENDSLKISLNIINHNVESSGGYVKWLYLPVSDWFFAGSKDNSPCISTYPFYPQSIVNEVYYYPSNYSSYNNSQGGCGVPPRLLIKYFPKVMILEEEDSIQFNLYYEDKNHKLFNDDLNYKIHIEISYSFSQDLFGLEEEIDTLHEVMLWYKTPKPYIDCDSSSLEYFKYLEEIQKINLSKFTTIPRKKDYRDFTKLKLTDCQSKIMEMCFLQRFVAECEIKFLNRNQK